MSIFTVCGSSAERLLLTVQPAKLNILSQSTDVGSTHRTFFDSSDNLGKRYLFVEVSRYKACAINL